MDKKKTLTIYTKEKTQELGDLFGIFFEDLNHAADGGLYAELVQNRSFEYDAIDHPSYHALMAWEKVERGNGQLNICVKEDNPLNEKNTHYLVMDIQSLGNGVGVTNTGFEPGIPIEDGKSYNFSCFARRFTSFNEPLVITLESVDGKVYGKTELVVSSSDWVKYEATLTAKGSDYSGRLVLTTKGQGELHLDMVSLFPKETYKNRSNGMRKDIAALLVDMKPKFMRFPGGCLVHDGSLNPDDRNSLYRWKNTLGDIEKRPSRRNNWGYNQTLGLGYYEYFQLAQDIGAKPLPVLPAGYDPHHQRIVPLEELQDWIDDALDLIEFANGDITTKWGGIRAELGHPTSFHLEYIAIGNEEVGAPFFERYPYFHKAIKEKYPDIKIINTSGPFCAGSEYERGWKSARENSSDLVDEHYYQTPEWFLANYHRYDNFKVDEPKVFLGEYATCGNTYYNALVEAAFMTGLEKNAQVIGLACYAPMLCNVNYVNWKPDMIWFDNHQVYGSANYYVQKLFMNHQGDQLIKTQLSGVQKNQGQAIQEQITPPITGKLSVAGNKVEAKFYEIKLINNDTGEEKNYADIFTNLKSSLVELSKTDWVNYTLSLKVKKVSGEKGFIVYFGEKDEDNRLLWEIGGWQNQDSMVSANINRRSSCLTQSQFNVEMDREYKLDLQVCERHIRTFIDGELINDTIDMLPVIEELYYSASIESSTGNIIIKVVNVQEIAVKSQLILDGIEVETLNGTIFEMAGYKPEDENSFETPQLVVPKQRDINFNVKDFFYEFPKQSITIFRLLS